MNNMSCGIYKITNNITNDFYIGSSSNIELRWIHHKSCTLNYKLYNDFKQFGLDNFSFEILEECEKQNLYQKEQDYIDLYNPTYNINRKVYNKNSYYQKSKISGIYKIINNITGDFYIGSSKNIKERWRTHKKQITWKLRPSKLYEAFQQYGLNNFTFLILENCDSNILKEKEQYYINKYHPIYNTISAYISLKDKNEYRKLYRKENIEEYNKYIKEWHKNNKDYDLNYYNEHKEKILEKRDKLKHNFGNKKWRENNSEYMVKYRKENFKKIQQQQKEWKEKNKINQKNYFNNRNSRKCIYNNKEYTFGALVKKFSRENIPNPTDKAKMYII